MKTLTIGLLFALLLLDPAFAGMKADREEAGFLGLVHTVHSESIEFSNKSGQWVEKVKFVQTMSYDQKGNWIGRVNYNPDGSFRSEERWVITYDAQGRITEINSEDKLEPLSGKKIYKYDSKGNISEETNYINDGSMGSRNAYVYDENGNISEELHYARDDSFVGKKVYKYAAGGNIVEEASYASRGKLLGNDLKGNMTMIHYRSDGSILSKEVFTYEANGTISEVFFYKPDGSLDGQTTYSYEYDSIRNWIKQREFHKGKVERLSVTYRTITYHPGTPNTSGKSE